MPVLPETARSLAADLDLRYLPAGFYADPYPAHRALHALAPVKRMPDGSFPLTRPADRAFVDRKARLFTGAPTPRAIAQPGAVTR